SHSSHDSIGGENSRVLKRGWQRHAFQTEAAIDPQPHLGLHRPSLAELDYAECHRKLQMSYQRSRIEKDVRLGRIQDTVTLSCLLERDSPHLVEIGFVPDHHGDLSAQARLRQIVVDQNAGRDFGVRNHNDAIVSVPYTSGAPADISDHAFLAG